MCDIIDEKKLWNKPENCNIALKELLNVNIAEYIMYLSASDGRISFEELQAYKAITGYGGETINSFKKYIEENNIYSMDFESNPPLIMTILSQSERNAIMCGAQIEESILKIVVTLYKIIGEIIISIDGGITYSEKRDLKIILRTMEEYAEEHSIVGNKWSLLGN